MGVGRRSVVQGPSEDPEPSTLEQSLGRTGPEVIAKTVLTPTNPLMGLEYLTVEPRSSKTLGVRSEHVR